MRKPLILTAFFVALLFVILSCHKSNSGGSSSGSLTGAWNFINMNVHSTATTNEGAGLTAVVVANYVTKDNSGTVVFTADSMDINSLGYTVDTTATAYIYLGSIVADSSEEPISQSLPPTSGNFAYQIIGTDSIYFPNGGLLPAGITGNGQGSGAHYTLSGNTLTLTSSASDTSNGAIEVGNAVITLEKQ
jgi:hypothetical protein